VRLDDGYVIYCRRRGVIENLGLGYDCCGFHCRRSRKGINLSLQCPLLNLVAVTILAPCLIDDDLLRVFAQIADDKW